MTAMQLNAEIFNNLSYLEDNEDYLHQALDAIKAIVKKKKNSVKATPVKKFKVDKSIPLPTDEFVGIASPNPEDDIKAKEEYFKEKYGRYL
ncbi:MAG: hypothetical protein PUF37_03725 [Prevotellaceae bacterium]|nr:hypothetical protein [Prevotellaceae bacterium]